MQSVYKHIPFLQAQPRWLKEISRQNR
jgi:hypothetical protein